MPARPTHTASTTANGILVADLTDIPVILVSGCDLSHEHPDSHHEPPQAFLSKPYSTPALYEALGLAQVSRTAGID